jgi:hypothetical protein
MTLRYEKQDKLTGIKVSGSVYKTLGACVFMVWFFNIETAKIISLSS